MCELKNIFQVLIYSQDFEKPEPSFKLFIWEELCPAILDDKLDAKMGWDSCLIAELSINLFQLEGRKEVEWVYFQEVNSAFKYDWNHPTFPSNINSLLATQKNVQMANIGVYFTGTSV